MPHQNIAIIRNAAAYDFGGGERFPVFLADSIKEKGFYPVIISRSDKLLEFSKDNSIKIIRGWWFRKQNWSGINNLLLPIYVTWQIILFFYYLALFSKLNPVVVHIQSKDDFIAATYAAKALNIRVVWTDHADLKHIWLNLSVWYKNPIGKIIYRAAKYVHAISVVSESEKSLITKHLSKNSPVRSSISVIYNGVVDTNTQHQPIKNSGFTYLIASRLVTDKGITEALEAFTELSKDYKDINLQIIGDGPEAEIFKEKVALIPGVTLLGHQSQPLSYMASADVFVHPTHHEGFSVALVEASMMSLPIIATSVGGNVEIIKNNETGLLVPVKNSRELYIAMKKLYADKELRDKLGKNARQQYLQKFQFNEIVEKQFIPLYKEII